MYFETLGPFQFNPNSYRRWRAEFWSELGNDDNYYKNIKAGIGCYAFFISRANKITPWYIGKTNSKKGFEGEIFQEHKLSIYRKVLQEKRGSAQMFLFPVITQNWNISRSRTSSDKGINWLEKTLIGMAFSNNPNIENISNTRYHRGVSVHGILGQQWPGRPSAAAQEAKRAFLHLD